MAGRPLGEACRLVGAWPALFRLNRELERWRRLGRRPVLWWRDDDARAPTPRLERLLSAARQLPIALAIIPDSDLAPLAVRLRSAGNVCVFQHGVDHQNTRPVPGGECEYPADARPKDVASRIAAARARMLTQGMAPIGYVPPWNRVDEILVEALSAAGFDTLSAGSQSPDPSGLRYLSTNVDIMRWKGTPRFRGLGRVLKSLRVRLAALRREARFHTPTGLLTHHLEHDDQAWDFLAWFVHFAEGRFHWADVSATVAPAARAPNPGP